MARIGFGLSLSSAVRSSRNSSPILSRSARHVLPLLLLWGALSFAQGVQPNESTSGEVALDNLNIHLDIPLVSKDGIGLPTKLAMHYNSNSWVGFNGSQVALAGASNGNAVAGGFWYIDGLYGLGGRFQPIVENICNGLAPQILYPTYTDGTGTVHSFTVPVMPMATSYGNCPPDNPITVSLPDGSGLVATIYEGGYGSVVDTSGVVSNITGTSNNSINDPNNNTLSISGGVLTDTLGVRGVTITGSPSTGSVTYTYPTATPTTTASVTISFASKSLQTGFYCNGVTDFPATSGFYFPTSISLPDGSSYSFTYELLGSATTGRLATITYPSGETVQYNYSGVRCYDGTPGTLTKIVSGDATYTYTRNSGTWTTDTIVANSGGANNTTVYTFANANVSTYPIPQVATQIVTKQGTSTLLQTQVFCYNNYAGTVASCPAPSPLPNLPIRQKDTYTTPAGSSISSRVSQTYDSYSNLTSTVLYDNGATTPTSQEIIGPYGYTWNALNCTTAIGNNVRNKPCQVQLENGSGAQLRNTYFAYDGNGNTLSKAVLTLAGGSQYLTTSATYNGNGTVATSFDANNNKTIYTQGDCNNGFVTTIAPPIPTLGTQYTWDCNGAKRLSATDPNGFPVTTTYSDPFWRPSSIADPVTGTVDFSYYPTPTVPLNSREAKMTFGSSDYDVFNQSDALGRPLYAQQIETSGGSWDTTQMGYSWNTNGRVTTKSMPCATAKSSGCTNGVTTVTHDALGRPLLTTDGGGGTITNTYTGSSTCTSPLTGCFITTSTLGPAPTGEVVKEVAKEYNGLGQLIASCAIASVSGGGVACGFGAYTGILTSYIYNTDGTPASVTRGSQIHSFIYDALGRTVTATYPESGIKYFYYDSTAGSLGVACPTALLTNSSPLGNLVKTYDANGTTTCFSYDTMNRNTSIAYAGTKWDGENKYFIYDSATVNGVAMTNSLGRVAEAYTAPTSSGSKVTDEGFSYTLRGEISDVYESTPNSSGYFHTTATYFGNGAVHTVGGVPGQGTLTYSLDGKGRPYSAILGSSTTLASTVTYNASDQPLVITLGLGDTDTYTYDQNTGRMTSYQFLTAGATAYANSKTLGWNQNGTLRQSVLQTATGNVLAVPVPCYYGTSSIAGYDDVGRLISVNCSGAGPMQWQQNFSYDAYNNITKTVPAGGTGITWQPGYYASNNKIIGATYDSNGNLLTDPFHTYTWNQDNHPLAMTDVPVSMTYDAFGHLVETNKSSAYGQELISPIGAIALMSGQTAAQFRMPLPGGTVAVSGTFANPLDFEHKDWLGSVPFITSATTRMPLYSREFAPYGEIWSTFDQTHDVNFTGDNEDLVQGTYDTPNRELNPNQGRWISPDPAHSGWNAYSYTTNPLGESDPTGLLPVRLLLPCQGLGGQYGCGGYDTFAMTGGNNNLDCSSGYCYNGVTTVTTTQQIGSIVTTSDNGYTYSWVPVYGTVTETSNSAASNGQTLPSQIMAANNGPQQPQNPQNPQQAKQQPQQQKRSTLETVCGNWNLINGSWASINFGLWLASVTPAAPAAAPTATVSSTLNAISGLGQFAVCP